MTVNNNAASAVRPTVVCLCGSTRFGDAFAKAQLDETLAGRIVLTIGCNMRSDADLFAHMSEQERADVKRNLDALHMRKIEMADEVLILNVGGYIGESTQNELKHALLLKKTVRFLEPENDPFWRVKQLEMEIERLRSSWAIAHLEYTGLRRDYARYEHEVMANAELSAHDEQYCAYISHAEKHGYASMNYVTWLIDQRQKASKPHEPSKPTLSREAIAQVREELIDIKRINHEALTVPSLVRLHDVISSLEVVLQEKS